MTPSVPPAAHGARRRSLSVVFAVLALAWMGAIFWVSSGPVPPFVPDSGWDLFLKKAGHFSAYALLAALWWLALRDRVSARWALIAAFAIAVGYAGSDEIHQAFSPTRHPALTDVGIDALGAAAGLWLATGLSRRRRADASPSMRDVPPG